MEFDEDAPLAQSFKRKRKAIKKKKEQQARPDEPPQAAHDPEPAKLPAAAEHFTANSQPEILVSEFDYSVENHFKAVDTMAKLCGYSETLDANQAEIKRFSNSITFLREWRDFNYKPRIVRFACQHNSKEKDVIGGATLSQFSAASVPKKETQDGSEVGREYSKDFVMHVGGAVWALDWCPGVDRNSENCIKSEFVAVAAHPPDSSYHKIGAPLTGRGAIQIWCLLTVYVKDVPSQGNKKSRPNSQKKGRVTSNELNKVPRPRGRPRKKSLVDSVEKIDTDNQHVQPLAVEYPMGSPRLNSSDRTSGNASKHVHDEDCVRIDKDSNRTGHPTALLLTGPKGRVNKPKAGKEDQIDNNGLHFLRQCEHGESSLVDPLTSASFSLDSMGPHKNITCISSCDANASKNSIPIDVALPRMMLCLAHNGKVAWDVKWRPVDACHPESMNIMGYLAVLLGNGALEVWEVPLPCTVKLVYPASREHIDPRFIKLQPVFRCSMLKCGDRRSIPLTVEWSVSSPHDMILAGCHDGVVALWKFSVGDSLTGSGFEESMFHFDASCVFPSILDIKAIISVQNLVFRNTSSWKVIGSYASFPSETRPLLSFSADTGPIRTLAWAPIQSGLEGANIIVTAGHKGFKFWDIRDPFRPLWDHPIQGVTYGLDWLPDPRCVFGSTEDGTMWLLSLEKASPDIPVTGKCHNVTSKHGFHQFDCSSYSIWSVQASRMTGMVAYCGEEGSTLCFQPTSRSLKDPSRNRLHHYLCGSLLEEESAIIVASPLPKSSFQKKSPSMKRSGAVKAQEKRAKEQRDKSLTFDEQPLAIRCGTDPVEEHGSDNSYPVIKKQAPKSKQSSKSQLKGDQETLLGRSAEGIREEEERGEEIEVFPSKAVAMHRVRWNVNKGSERWLCYGGAAGLVRCQEVDFSVFQ